MKINKLYLLAFTLITMTFHACQVDDPIASEQYRKEIYIVGAYDNVLPFDLPYGDNQEAYISLAVSGSLRIDRDVKVNLKPNNESINWYNKKYMLDAPIKYQQLDVEDIDISSWSTTIKSGDIYSHLPFTVNSTKLHCDSLYALSFTIESVSDYMISQKDTSLILTLNMINDFSGTYQMEASKIALSEDENGEWTETGLPVPVSSQRTLTAVSADTVRFFHEKQKETLAEYANSWNPGEDYFNAINRYCINFGRIGDSKLFTVEPWGTMTVIEGEAKYEDDLFTFWYDYKDGNTRNRMKGTFKK